MEHKDWKIERTIHQTVNPCKPNCMGETPTCNRTCPAYIAWQEFEKNKAETPKTYWVKGLEPGHKHYESEDQK